VVRYVDPQNYYRFSLDAQRGYRRLVKFVQGQPALLWEDRIDHLPGVWHELTLSARGDVLRVGWNGLTLCEVQDTSLPNGRAGLYCWAGTGVRFDDFTVQAPPAPRATLVAIDHPGRDELAVTAPESAGGLYILALSGGRQPGMPMSSLQIGDTRTWPLNPDAWFFASLQPSPFLQQFVGTLDVQGLATASVLPPPRRGRAARRPRVVCGRSGLGAGERPIRGNPAQRAAATALSGTGGAGEFLRGQRTAA
jgi:hypothetical protein